MSIFENVNTIMAISKLLNPNDSSSDSEEETAGGAKSTNTSKTVFTNYNLKSKTEDSPVKSNDIQTTNTNENIPKSIDEWEKIQENENDDFLETRKRPEYNISYKQRVTTEDIFLQMGNKTGATASCEEIMLEIKMPDELCEYDKMELNVSKHEIDLKTPSYRLKLPLMHTVNPDKGKAFWNKETKIFTIHLVMEREFDFVNF